MKVEIKVLETGKIIKADKAIIGGVLFDETKFPFGMFTGDLDLQESCIVMEHAIRATLKILHDEQNIDYDQIYYMFERIVANAISLEIESKSPNFDRDEVIMKVSTSKDK